MAKNGGTGALLSAPLSTAVRSEVKFWRGQNQSDTASDSNITYKNLSGEFKLQMVGRTYERQFYHVYRSRLESLKPRIEAAAKQKYGNLIQIRSLCDLGNDGVSSDGGDNRVLVMGTTFKVQELKPSILKEISEDNEIQIQPLRDR